LSEDEEPAQRDALPTFTAWSPLSHAASWKKKLVLAVACALPLILASLSDRVFGGGGSAAGLVSALPILTVLLAVFMIPTTVDVGADGVHTRWLGKGTFTRFSRLERVDRARERRGDREILGIDLALSGGEVRRVLVADTRFDDGGRDRMFEQVHSALEAFRARDQPIEVSALARRGRESAAWLASLRAIGNGAEADHRRAPVPVETLLRIVEDAAADGTARAAAAVAASSAAAPAERERIRIAAASTASPRLRVALERAAEGGEDDAPLVESLSELESEAADTVSRSAPPPAS
jgi:hypothetical protein